MTAELGVRPGDAWEELLQRFEFKGDGLLGSIATGDET